MTPFALDVRVITDISPGSLAAPCGEGTFVQLDPTQLQRDVHARFVAQWPLADLTTFRFAYSDNGDVATQLETSDGSVARVWHTPQDDGYLVTQAGPRRLWEQVEHAVALWNNEGRPHYDRFGITATPTEQYVWYDHPHSAHRWPLHLPRQATPQPA